MLLRGWCVDLNLNTLGRLMSLIGFILLHLIPDLRLNVVEGLFANCLILRLILQIPDSHILAVELLSHLLCACSA